MFERIEVDYNRRLLRKAPGYLSPERFFASTRHPGGRPKFGGAIGEGGKQDKYDSSMEACAAELPTAQLSFLKRVD